MEALRERRSTRAFAARPLDRQTLSNLLWAAWGRNRDDGHRTAPSARNWQEIDLYLAMPEGLYRYDGERARLEGVRRDDIRAHTGLQDFVAAAPLNIALVADLAKMTDAATRDRKFYAAADAGFISQNIYLFCASEGLATVVRGLIDRPALARHMRLRPDQRIMLAQSIGYPTTEAS